LRPLRIIASFTCAKNNNGEMPAPTEWRRTASGFDRPLEDSDWDEFHGEGSGRPSGVTREHLQEVFGHGEKWLKRTEAAKALGETAGVSTAAYGALEEKGRFAKWMRKNPTDGRVSIRKEAAEEEEGE
jgi:hypothetical protein